LLLFRTTTKVLSTTFSKLRQLAEHDGRIHTTFNLNGTATGRLSSARPNLQNLPLYAARVTPPSQVASISNGIPVKVAFVTEGEERVYFQMDIGAAEIRVLCAYAPDPGLIEAMLDPTMDIHSFVASEIFGIDYATFVAQKDIDPDIKLKRTATKRVIFGIVYGAGASKIAEQIYDGLSTDPIEMAKQIEFAASVIEMIMSRFPKIDDYIKSTHGEVRAKGWVRTFFGRYRRFPLAKVSNKLRSRSERMAVNFKIQSTASDIVLSQLCEVEQNIASIGGEVLLTVHDSIAGTIAVSRLMELRAFFDYYVVQRVKERFPWLPVPFAYDLEVGASYGELVSFQVLEEGIESVREKDRPKVLAILAKAGIVLPSSTEVIDV
jgi:DNA polymerase-1